jgi:hypothetical protein
MRQRGIMAYDQTRHEGERFEPIITSRLVIRLMLGVAAFAALSAAAAVGGRWVGERIAMAGHSTSTELFRSTIGEDVFDLPANVIRFENQRHAGPKASLDLYFRWPDMQGYSAETRDDFNAVDGTSAVIFVSLTPQIMSKDMSGRYAPIYSHLVEGAAAPGPSGLSIHRLTHVTGYAGELLYVESGATADPYVVRCLDDTDASSFGLTTTACQRDILVGSDTSVLYRFPAALLPEWQSVEEAVRQYLDVALQD